MTDWTRAHIEDWARGCPTDDIEALVADDREYFERIVDSLLDDEGLVALIADPACIRSAFLADLLAERLCDGYRIPLPSPSALLRWSEAHDDTRLGDACLMLAKRLRKRALLIDRLRRDDHPSLRAVALRVIAFHRDIETDGERHRRRMRDALAGRRDADVATHANTDQTSDRATDSDTDT